MREELGEFSITTHARQRAMLNSAQCFNAKLPVLEQARDLDFSMSTTLGHVG